MEQSQRTKQSRPPLLYINQPKFPPAEHSDAKAVHDGNTEERDCCRTTYLERGKRTGQYLPLKRTNWMTIKTILIIIADDAT